MGHKYFTAHIKNYYCMLELKNRWENSVKSYKFFFYGCSLRCIEVWKWCKISAFVKTIIVNASAVHCRCRCIAHLSAPWTWNFLLRSSLSWKLFFLNFFFCSFSTRWCCTCVHRIKRWQSFRWCNFCENFWLCFVMIFCRIL